MSIGEFIILMESLGLTPNQITYLLDLENIRQANGLYSDLDTLASLVCWLARPQPPLCEIHAIGNVNDDCATAVLIS